MSKRRRKTTPARPDAESQSPPAEGLGPESVPEARAAAAADTILTVEVGPVAESRLLVSPSETAAQVEQTPLTRGFEPLDASATPMASAAVGTGADGAAEPLRSAVPPTQSTDPVVEWLAAATAVADPPASVRPPSSLAEERASAVVEVPPRLGTRLRAARESRGISREDMARRLRVSPTVVSDLESENWARLGAPVYVRGHLKNYARMLDIPQVAVAHAVNRMGEVAPLMPSLPAAAGASWSGRNRHAFTYLVYALLSLMLAIPTYTMLNNRGINSPEPLVADLPVNSAREASAAGATVGETSLTLPVQASADSDALTTVDLESASATVPATATTDPSSPMMASMTPLAEPSPPPAPTAGQHLIEIVFSDRSWVELLDADGGRLEYGILGAGESRRYPVVGPVSLRIGNVGAVTLSVDGKRVDLGAYARQNVARLKLFGPASEIPAVTR